MVDFETASQGELRLKTTAREAPEEINIASFVDQPLRVLSRSQSEKQEHKEENIWTEYASNNEDNESVLAKDKMDGLELRRSENFRRRAMSFYRGETSDMWRDE